MGDNACAAYACNTTTGQCDRTDTVCNDNDACTDDSCDPVSGCVYTTKSCTDSNLCTTDSCNVTTGCVFTPVTCDSGLGLCSVDTCSPTVGCIYQNVSCTDGNFNTIDSCDPGKGCVYTTISCNDTNACTADSNTPQGCVYTPVNCDFGDKCKVYGCNTTTGCTETPVVCTPADPACQTSVCENGVCITDGIECDDGDPCTVDSCAAGVGCQYTPVVCQEAPCHLLACNGTTGQCEITGPVNCDDGDSCTDDICDPSCVDPLNISTCVGCVHLNITCQPTTPCNFPIACDGSGPTPICILTNISSLFDFCGNCLGDNTECFFSSLIDTQEVVGISAGVAAGIAVAVIAAVLIAMWFSKKGYDYYRAQSDNAAAGMHMNPYFVNNELAGEMAPETVRN